MTDKQNSVKNAPVQPGQELVALTARVAAAYLGANPVSRSEIPGVINTVHQALSALHGADSLAPRANIAPAAAQPLMADGSPRKAAVPIKRSIHPDYIVCLEDGKKLKMLKRHLRTAYNLTPEEYRSKWNLPPDYPMVAPNYAAQRSAFAKKIGLGRTGRTAH